MRRKTLLDKCDECGAKLVVKKVPHYVSGVNVGMFTADVCPKCGEEYYDFETSENPFSLDIFGLGNILIYAIGKGFHNAYMNTCKFYNARAYRCWSRRDQHPCAACC